MKRILRFYFRKLRKSDFRSTYFEVISITKKHNPETLHLSSALDRMEAGVTEADYLVVPEKINPVTDTYTVIREERNKYVIYLVGQTRVHYNGVNGEMKTAANVFKPFVNRILRDFRRKSYSTQTDMMKQFFDELDSTVTLQQASVTLGLSATIADIRRITDTLFDTYELKRVTRSVRLKMRTDEIKINLSVLMTEFFDYIELMSQDYPALDYNPLINELNVALQAQLQQIRLRSTLSSNAETITESTTTANAAVLSDEKAV